MKSIRPHLPWPPSPDIRLYLARMESQLRSAGGATGEGVCRQPCGVSTRHSSSQQGTGTPRQKRLETQTGGVGADSALMRVVVDSSHQGYEIRDVPACRGRCVIRPLVWQLPPAHNAAEWSADCSRHLYLLQRPPCQSPAPPRSSREGWVQGWAPGLLLATTPRWGTLSVASSCRHC